MDDVLSCQLWVFGVRNDFQRREGTRGERGAKGGVFLVSRYYTSSELGSEASFFFLGRPFSKLSQDYYGG